MTVDRMFLNDKYRELYVLPYNHFIVQLIKREDDILTNSNMIISDYISSIGSFEDIHGIQNWIDKLSKDKVNLGRTSSTLEIRNKVQNLFCGKLAELMRNGFLASTVIPHRVIEAVFFKVSANIYCETIEKLANTIPNKPLLKIDNIRQEKPSKDVVREGNSFKNILRWGAFVPASLIVFVAGYALFVYGQKTFISAEDGGIIDTIIKLVGNVIAVAMACYVGIQIVPNKKELARKIVSIVFILLGASSIILGFMGGTNDFSSLLSALIVIITACYVLFSKDGL